MLSNKIKNSGPEKFIGRKSRVCPKCSSAQFYVNRLGGLLCCQCNPPSCDRDQVLRLDSVDGTWQREFDQSPQSSELASTQTKDIAINAPSSSQVIDQYQSDVICRLFDSNSTSDSTEPLTAYNLYRSVAPACSYPRPERGTPTEMMCGSHKKQAYWRSIYGPHWICAICHPAVNEQVIAERILDYSWESEDSLRNLLDFMEV